MSANPIDIPDGTEPLQPVSGTQLNPLAVDVTVAVRDDTFEYGGNDGPPPSKLTPVVLNTETSGTASVTTYSDQCGREESDSNSQGNAQHAIEGLFDQETVQYLYQIYKSGAKVEITLPADLDTVDVFITDMTMKQGGDTHSTLVTQLGIEVPVWHTQVQLKQSGAINNNG